MKKGFTLIELLAVIIILAIVALIATPIVLDVVDDARTSAAKSETAMIVSGINNYCATAEMKAQMNNTICECAEGVTKEDIAKMVDLGNAKVLELTFDEQVTYLKVESNGKEVEYDGTSYKIDGEVVDTPEQEEPTNPVDPNNVYKCKRATSLHEETCSQSDPTFFCSGEGKNGTIKYGNLGQKEVLSSGDAFDCDVNGDGKYDAITERFYYVSDLESDSSYAVLVYYNNTNKGVADNTAAGLIAYDSNNTNNNGPVTAIVNLPTTTQWKNVSLSNTERTLTTKEGNTTTNWGPLPEVYSYAGYAARLLTTNEINSACKITVGEKEEESWELKECNYLLENTKYSSDAMGTYGYWLETPGTKRYSWAVFGYIGSPYEMDSDSIEYYGVRPVIEVLKTEISY